MSVWWKQVLFLSSRFILHTNLHCSLCFVLSRQNCEEFLRSCHQRDLANIHQLTSKMQNLNSCMNFLSSKNYYLKKDLAQAQKENSGEVCFSFLSKLDSWLYFEQVWRISGYTTLFVVLFRIRIRSFSHLTLNLLSSHPLITFLS